MELNKKGWLTCILLSGWFLMAQAQNNSLGKNDPEAKKVLDGLSAKLKSFKAVDANFTLEVEDSKGKLQGRKSGGVYVNGSKYHISIIGGEDVFHRREKHLASDKSDHCVNTH